MRPVRPNETSSNLGDAYLEADLLSEVRQVEAVEVAAGSVSGFAQMIDSTGEPIGGQGPPTLGFSWVVEPALNSLSVSEDNGRAPTSAGEVAIDIATAKSQGFAVGDEIDIQTVGGIDTFTIVGLANFGSEDNLAGATISAFELEQAQVLFDLEGRLSAIDVLAVDGVDSDALVAEISVVLPGTAEVVTGEQQTQEQLDQVTEGLGFLSTALLAFAGIAVFVGAFVIQNTFRITVAQRVRELALLRAIGATGTQVTVLVLVEAAILAVVASAVGVLAGIGVAELIKMAMNAAGVGIPDGPLTIQPRTIIISMAVGIVVTMFAALLPARKASSIPPVAAMSETGARTTPKSLRTRTIVGSALTALGALAMTIGLMLENGGSLPLVTAGAVGLFHGHVHPGTVGGRTSRSTAFGTDAWHHREAREREHDPTATADRVDCICVDDRCCPGGVHVDIRRLHQSICHRHPRRVVPSRSCIRLDEFQRRCQPGSRR